MRKDFAEPQTGWWELIVLLLGVAVVLYLPFMFCLFVLPLPDASVSKPAEPRVQERP